VRDIVDINISQHLPGSFIKPNPDNGEINLDFTHQSTTTLDARVHTFAISILVVHKGASKKLIHSLGPTVTHSSGGTIEKAAQGF
jgi:hypothetical protein